MANNTDLVSELRIIENWFKRESEKYRGDSIAMGSAKSRMLAFADTLQRARAALCWIPVSERLPEKNGAYEVWVRTDSLRGGYTDTVYFLDGTWPTDLEIQAWRPQIPYTPEEK